MLVNDILSLFSKTAELDAKAEAPKKRNPKKGAESRGGLFGDRPSLFGDDDTLPPILFWLLPS